VGRSSPPPFDKTNCALDYDSPLGFSVIISSRWGKAGLWVDFRGSSFDGPSGSRGHFGWTTNQSGGAENRYTCGSGSSAGPKSFAPAIAAVENTEGHARAVHTGGHLALNLW